MPSPPGAGGLGCLPRSTRPAAAGTARHDPGCTPFRPVPRRADEDGVFARRGRGRAGLSRNGTGALRGQPREYAGPPLLLADAVLGSFRYETDRGERVLPTWEVHAQGVFHPIQVLDPAAISSGQVWEPPGRKRITGQRPTVILGADGRTLTMSFTGSPYADSDQDPARTLESGNAVALVFTERMKPRRSGWYTAHGVRREVTAVLPSPLANRVLLDIKGGPVIVTPEH